MEHIYLHSHIFCKVFVYPLVPAEPSLSIVEKFTAASYLSRNNQHGLLLKIRADDNCSNKDKTLL